MAKAKSEFLTVVCVNIPNKYLEYIDQLTDVLDGIYPSRSEYVREAIKNQISRDRDLVEYMKYIKEGRSPLIQKLENDYDPNKDIIRIPIDLDNRIYKEVKVIRRLE